MFRVFSSTSKFANNLVGNWMCGNANHFIHSNEISSTSKHAMHISQLINGHFKVFFTPTLTQVHPHRSYALTRGIAIEKYGFDGPPSIVANFHPPSTYSKATEHGDMVRDITAILSSITPIVQLNAIGNQKLDGYPLMIWKQKVRKLEMEMHRTALEIAKDLKTPILTDLIEVADFSDWLSAVEALFQSATHYQMKEREFDLELTPGYIGWKDIGQEIKKEKDNFSSKYQLQMDEMKERLNQSKKKEEELKTSMSRSLQEELMHEVNQEEFTWLSPADRKVIWAAIRGISNQEDLQSLADYCKVIDERKEKECLWLEQQTRARYQRRVQLWKENMKRLQETILQFDLHINAQLANKEKYAKPQMEMEDMQCPTMNKNPVMFPPSVSESITPTRDSTTLNNQMNTETFIGPIQQENTSKHQESSPESSVESTSSISSNHIHGSVSSSQELKQNPKLKKTRLCLSDLKINQDSPKITSLEELYRYEWDLPIDEISSLVELEFNGVKLDSEDIIFMLSQQVKFPTVFSPNKDKMTSFDYNTKLALDLLPNDTHSITWKEFQRDIKSAVKLCTQLCQELDVLSSYLNHTTKEEMRQSLQSIKIKLSLLSTENASEFKNMLTSLSTEPEFYTTLLSNNTDEHDISLEQHKDISDEGSSLSPTDPILSTIKQFENVDIEEEIDDFYEDSTVLDSNDSRFRWNNLADDHLIGQPSVVHLSAESPVLDSDTISIADPPGASDSKKLQVLYEIELKNISPRIAVLKNMISELNKVIESVGFVSQAGGDVYSQISSEQLEDMLECMESNRQNIYQSQLQGNSYDRKDILNSITWCEDARFSSLLDYPGANAMWKDYVQYPAVRRVFQSLIKQVDLNAWRNLWSKSYPGKSNIGHMLDAQNSSQGLKLLAKMITNQAETASESRLNSGERSPMASQTTQDQFFYFGNPFVLPGLPLSDEINEPLEIEALKYMDQRNSYLTPVEVEEIKKRVPLDVHADVDELPFLADNHGCDLVTGEKIRDTVDQAHYLTKNLLEDEMIIETVNQEFEQTLLPFWRKISSQERKKIVATQNYLRSIGRAANIDSDSVEQGHLINLSTSAEKDYLNNLSLQSSSLSFDDQDQVLQHIESFFDVSANARSQDHVKKSPVAARKSYQPIQLDQDVARELKSDDTVLPNRHSHLIDFQKLPDPSISSHLDYASHIEVEGLKANDLNTKQFISHLKKQYFETQDVKDHPLFQSEEGYRSLLQKKIEGMNHLTKPNLVQIQSHDLLSQQSDSNSEMGSSDSYSLKDHTLSSSSTNQYDTHLLPSFDNGMVQNLHSAPHHHDDGDGRDIPVTTSDILSTNLEANNSLHSDFMVQRRRNSMIIRMLAKKGLISGEYQESLLYDAIHNGRLVHPIDILDLSNPIAVSHFLATMPDEIFGKDTEFDDLAIQTLTPSSTEDIDFLFKHSVGNPAAEQSDQPSSIDPIHDELYIAKQYYDQFHFNTNLESLEDQYPKLDKVTQEELDAEYPEYRDNNQEEIRQRHHKLIRDLFDPSQSLLAFKAIRSYDLSELIVLARDLQALLVNPKSSDQIKCLTCELLMLLYDPMIIGSDEKVQALQQVIPRPINPTMLQLAANMQDPDNAWVQFIHYMANQASSSTTLEPLTARQLDDSTKPPIVKLLERLDYDKMKEISSLLEQYDMDGLHKVLEELGAYEIEPKLHDMNVQMKKFCAKMTKLQADLSLSAASFLSHNLRPEKDIYWKRRHNRRLPVRKDEVTLEDEPELHRMYFLAPPHNTKIEKSWGEQLHLVREIELKREALVFENRMHPDNALNWAKQRKLHLLSMNLISPELAEMSSTETFKAFKRYQDNINLAHGSYKSQQQREDVIDKGIQEVDITNDYIEPNSIQSALHVNTSTVPSGHSEVTGNDSEIPSLDIEQLPTSKPDTLDFTSATTTPTDSISTPESFPLAQLLELDKLKQSPPSSPSMLTYSSTPKSKPTVSSLVDKANVEYVVDTKLYLMEKDFLKTEEEQEQEMLYDGHVIKRILSDLDQSSKNQVLQSYTSPKSDTSALTTQNIDEQFKYELRSFIQDDIRIVNIFPHAAPKKLPHLPSMGHSILPVYNELQTDPNTLLWSRNPRTIEEKISAQKRGFDSGRDLINQLQDGLEHREYDPLPPLGRDWMLSEANELGIHHWRESDRFGEGAICLRIQPDLYDYDGITYGCERVLILLLEQAKVFLSERQVYRSDNAPIPSMENLAKMVDEETDPETQRKFLLHQHALKQTPENEFVQAPDELCELLAQEESGEMPIRTELLKASHPVIRQRVFNIPHNMLLSLKKVKWPSSQDNFIQKNTSDLLPKKLMTKNGEPINYPETNPHFHISLLRRRMNVAQGNYDKILQRQDTRI